VNEVLSRYEQENAEMSQALETGAHHSQHRSVSRPRAVQEVFNRIEKDPYDGTRGASPLRSRPGSRASSPPHSRGPSRGPTRDPSPSGRPGSRDRSPHRAQEVFDKLDQNHDGVISRREWDSAYEPQRLFDKLDFNGDGLVSRKEFSVAYVAPEGNENAPLSSQSIGMHDPSSNSFKEHNAALRRERERMTNMISQTRQSSHMRDLDDDDDAVDAITRRMKGVEERLQRRQERAAAEKEKVNQVEADLKQYRQARENATMHATEFSETAADLHRSCSTLEQEFQVIMDRASKLRDSLALS